MKSKIYTLTGDGGTTALVGGSRVNKDDVRVEAYGSIDELNAFVGVLAHNTKLDDDWRGLLRHIQNKLFNLGAYLATPAQKQDGTVQGLTDDDVKALEQKIDAIDTELPPLQGFVLPGGCRLAVWCHVCRTVARRAERRVVALSHEAPVAPVALRYLNRLSDFFFVFARFNNINEQNDEIYWDKDS